MHLVLPERPLFSRDKAEPSASIVLKVRGTLEPQQVRAIRHLVASAVNGLKPRAGLGRRRNRPAAGRRRAQRQRRRASTADERKIAFERRLREQVETIVTSVVGPGRARVQLTADFDFNRVTQTSDKFDPEGRVVRSSQTREEIIGQRRRPATARSRSATNCRAASAPAEGAQPAARPEPQDRGNRQLRDFAHHQDRGDRRRPRQPHLGRGAGRRQLHQERQGRARLSAARARKRSTASPRWCAPRSASTRSAATRSRSSTCASPRRRRTSISEPTGWLSIPAVHQGRHHARHRARRDGAARPDRAADRGAPAGAPHHRARTSRRPRAGAPAVADRRSPARRPCSAGGSPCRRIVGERSDARDVRTTPRR